MGLKQQDQFKTIVYDLAKSLAAINNAPWEKVKLLYSYCPQIVDDYFEIHPYSLDCIIALGTYYIESDFSHSDNIIPYLLNLLKGLILAKWFNEDDNTETPYAEKFAFCLNTLLSEAYNSVNKDVFMCQTNEIANIYTNLLADLKNGFDNDNVEKQFFTVKLPVFLGLTQSMARYNTNETSFFCHIFPKYKDYVGISHHIKAIYESAHINLVSIVCKTDSQMFPKSCSHTFRGKCCDYSSEHIMNTVKIVHSLLSNEILKLFQERLTEMNNKLRLIAYYFKNVKGILKCAALILYRDVLSQSSNLTEFISNTKDFIDPIYLSLQKHDMQRHRQTGSLVQEENVLRKLKVNVLTKIMCLELVVLTVKDLSDAENICAHVTATIKCKQIDKKVLIINAPYTVACMNVIGTLADRFPVLSDVCVKALQDFLSSPSSTLKNLCTDSYIPTGANMNVEKNKLLPKPVWFEYRIFKKVQNSAIENLCISLKSTCFINENYMPAFLTKFSSLLFVEKHQPEYELILENVVVTLGHISYSIPSLSMSILQCFQQRLRRHSIESDIAIIHQLGNMLIFNQNMNVFIGALKTLSNLIMEVISDAKKELKHISKDLFHVLFNVAERLTEYDKITKIWFTSFEIFVQAGLDELRSTEVVDFEKDNTKSNLLRLIGLLSVKLKCNNMFKRHERLFQDFWLYFVLSSKESLIIKCNSDLKLIVYKLPTLTLESLTDHDLREFFYSSSLNQLKIPATKQNQLKTFILNFLGNPSEISILINKLTFPQTVYIYSICALENIRIKNSENPSIEYLFCYLTNVKLQNDKYGVWHCICKIAEDLFKIFLDVLLTMEWNDARELVLEKQVQILLINFNNIHSQIRHIADKFLSELIDVFPHLLWNRRVMWSVFDIVAVLHYSVTIESNDQVQSLRIPNTDFSIFLMNTKKSREDVFNDFVARSKEIISEARKWAPTIVNSHIQEYVTRDDYLFTKIDSVYQLRRCAWIFVCTNEKSLHEISDVISSMTVRSRIIGEVTGLMEKSDLSPINFGKSLAEEVWKACSNQDLSSYQICLQRVTAFAIKQQVFMYEIKRVLVGSCIMFFTEDTIFTALHCWNWLCAAHPDFELELLMEMFETWEYTIANRMGLFTIENGDQNHQIAFTERTSHPHNVWIEFITQQISSSKYSCQNKLEMIINFLHKTLPMNIGGSDCVMSRSVEYIVARFSLLSSTLSLLQYDIPVSRIDLVIIRQRIYCSCLDYFCCLRRFPVNNGLHLKLDIDILVKFWHILYSDKKHITKQFPNNIQERITRTRENIISLNNKKNSGFSINSYDSLILYDSFSLDVFKKRKLALCLLADEIEFLSTWYDPLHNDDMSKIKQWQANFFSPNRSLSEFTKTAWDISPILTVYLPVRLRYERITNEISKLILKNPAVVSHIPHAMNYLATVENIQNDCKELNHLLTWADTKPLQVINLLSKSFHHPTVLQYAMKTLLNVDVNVLTSLIPQLVQSLRYDTLGYIHNFLLQSSKRNQLFCHQLIWNINANMYSDINMTSKSTLFDQLSSLHANIINGLTTTEKIFYEREFEFINQITDVSCKIPRNLKRDEKKSACLMALKSIKMCPGCYLPSSPDALICEIDYNSGLPLQSKARTPYLANFLVYRCSYNKVLDIGMQVSQKQLDGCQLDEIDCNNKTWYPKLWQRTIFKAADDVRQDILALQTIQYLKNVFQEIGLDVFLFPYKVVAVAPGMGVIECIPNANSRDQLGKQTNVRLYDYFVTTFGNEKSTRFQEAQKNFIKSVAAYSIVSFLFQIKDRHNGNIMVDDEGRVIHIDFGFMFESSPGGNMGFEPDMKLTGEMLMIMGGSMDTELFQWFTELSVKAYLAARRHQEEIITLVTLMLDSGLPCFRGQTIKLLRERFAPNASDGKAANFIITIIRNSCLNLRTNMYDVLQYLQNSIQY